MNIYTIHVPITSQLILENNFIDYVLNLSTIPLNVFVRTRAR